MKLENAIVVCCVTILLTAWLMSLREHKSSAGRSEADRHVKPSDAESSAGVSPRPAAGVLSTNGQVVQADREFGQEPPTESGASDGVGAGSTPALATNQLDELALMLTPEALFDVTIELWAQEEFDALTAEERTALLPLDDGMMAQAGRVRDLFGGLPTIEDVEQGYRAEAVQLRYAEWEALDEVIGELQLVPRARRSATYEATLRGLRADERAAYLALAEALTRATNYKYWVPLARLYQEWCRPEE